MIRLLASALSLVSILAAFSQAHADTPPETVTASFDKIYVPLGFDSNDNVQLVGEGSFVNTCFKPAPTKFTIDIDKKTVHLEPQALRYDGMCLMVVLPYNRQVDLGILPAGDWTVTQGPNKAVIGKIDVASTLTKDADDFIYAPVSQAYFNQTEEKRQIVLSLELPCDALPVDQIKVHVQKDVLVIQPILKNEMQAGCRSTFLPVKKVIDIDKIPAGRYLLHVRSMNGNAVNSLVEVN